MKVFYQVIGCDAQGYHIIRNFKNIDNAIAFCEKEKSLNLWRDVFYNEVDFDD